MSRQIVLIAVLAIALGLEPWSQVSANPVAAVGGAVKKTLGGVANAVRGALRLRRGGVPPQLKEVSKEFNLEVDTLTKIKDEMVLEMDCGLSVGSNSPLLMLPTHLTKLPSGQETGDIIALDLGGTNFRVLKVKLLGAGKWEVDSGKFRVDESLMYAPGEQLFDFIAEKVKEKCPETAEASAPVPLGFTFSFPVQQPSIDVGKLVQWTKGFTCPGVEGEDVCALLHKSFEKLGLNIKIVALVNDTPGTMFAGAYKDPNVAAGLILGTGTNLCYVEKVARAPKLQTVREFNKLPSVATWCNAPYASSGQVHVINTEWGGFDSGKQVQALPISAYDVVLDRRSVNPGEHLYEKMISGMFLGEIARLVASGLIAKGHLFKGDVSESFVTQNGFTTEAMANIEGSAGVKEMQRVLEELGIMKPTESDCRLMRSICEMISTRAARLVAAGLAAVAERSGRVKDFKVAVDGTVFSKYPRMQARITAALKELLGNDMGVTFTEASDGSGVGAALAAAAVSA